MNLLHCPNDYFRTHRGGTRNIKKNKNHEFQEYKYLIWTLEQNDKKNDDFQWQKVKMKNFLKSSKKRFQVQKLFNLPKEQVPVVSWTQHIHWNCFEKK